MIIEMIRFLMLVSLFFSTNIFVVREAQAAATVPLSITVNGSLVISDADIDTMAGKDPTKNVTISITPDLGQVIQTGTANFRIRTNRTAWRLTGQRTASSAGGTGLTDSDVLVDIAKSAGSTANAASGALVVPFTAQTTLASIPVPPTAAADVISGTAKTSSAKDNSNTNNYFQVNTTYSVQPDFFYTPGTFSTTITYGLVSP